MTVHLIVLMIMKKVQKVWGNELWLANTDKYCGKILNVNNGHCCSIHYHKNKDETFYILEGKIRLELFGETITLKEGESIRLQPYSLHRFCALENSKIIEISTHHEDSDSYRVVKSDKCDFPFKGTKERF